MNVLFICGRNRLRSPTAEQIFADCDGIEVASAGLNHDSDVPLSPELLQWADLIFVMEEEYRTRLSRRFREQLDGKRVICLGIPDRYEFMDPELVKLLEQRVTRHLPRS